MDIKKLYEKTANGFKEFMTKVDVSNVIGLTDELAKYIKKDSDEYLKPNTNSYVAEINPDIDTEGDIPTINFVYGDGTSNKVYLDLASEDSPGLMTSDDKAKINKYVGVRLNIPRITYINEENQNKYAYIGYDGFKYTNGNTTFEVANDNIDIENDSIKINENEISFTRGADTVKLNQTGFNVSYRSTDSADSSNNSITVTAHAIKNKYFIDNSMSDKDDEEGDFTYTLPKANGRLLVDTENEANPNFVNVDKTKKLTIGYDGIKYNVTNDEDGSENIAFNVTSDGTCNASSFTCSYYMQKVSVGTTVDNNGVSIYNNGPMGNISSNLSNTELKFNSNSNGFWDEESSSSSTSYKANGITKNDFTYSFPDKSGTIELVDEEKDDKLKQITNFGGIDGYQYSTSFANIEELINYVKTEKNTEARMSVVNNQEIGSIILAMDGSITYSTISTDGFVTIKGKIDFDSSNADINKLVGVTCDEAILPNDISILDDVDTNKSYSLDIAKCLELGILVEKTTSSETINAKSFNLLN